MLGPGFFVTRSYGAGRTSGLNLHSNPADQRGRPLQSARTGSQAAEQSFAVAVAGLTHGTRNYRRRGVHVLHLGLAGSHALCTAASYALLE
jgi:hypothetical protein